MLKISRKLLQAFQYLVRKSGDFLIRLNQVRNHHGDHLCIAACANAVEAVLDHNALRRVLSKQLRRLQKNIRIGLSPLHGIPADHFCKVGTQAGHFQIPLCHLLRTGSGDGGRNFFLLQPRKTLSGTRL